MHYIKINVSRSYLPTFSGINNAQVHTQAAAKRLKKKKWIKVSSIPWKQRMAFIHLLNNWIYCHQQNSYGKKSAMKVWKMNKSFKNSKETNTYFLLSLNWHYALQRINDANFKIKIFLYFVHSVSILNIISTNM